MVENIEAISTALHTIANAVNSKTRLEYHLGADTKEDGRKMHNGKNIYVVYQDVGDDKKEKIGKAIQEILND